MFDFDSISELDTDIESKAYLDSDSESEDG